MRQFVLSCESTIDLPYEKMRARDVEVLFYSCTANGEIFEDDMDRNPEALDAFYEKLESGTVISTSQINDYTYYGYFKELLEKGDVLHIAFGSGMTKSVYNAQRAAERLREKYPEHKLIVIDSTCSCAGYGLLTEYAADLRDRGASLEETAAFAEANKLRVRHEFFSTDLSFYRKSGRMSGPAAMLAAVLNICPILHLNRAGEIIAYSKVRGRKNAVKEVLRVMEEHAENGTAYDGKCVICHSKCAAEAELLKAAIEEKFPNLRGRTEVYPIGMVIASHCGPGTVALFFMGDEREE